MSETYLESFENTASKGSRSVNKNYHNQTKSLHDLLSQGWDIQENEESIPSGYKNLDDCLGSGFTYGYVYSFLGKDNTSKSSFLMNLVKQMCKTNLEEVKEEWVEKYPKSGAAYAYGWPEETLKSIVDFKCKDSLKEWSKTQAAQSSLILGAFNHWQVYQKKNVNSFIYFDKEYTSESFYKRFLKGSKNIKKEAQNFSENYHSFYHKQFDEQHQSGWYYKWISEAIDSLPNPNVRVLFFDGVQCPVLLNDLGKIARDYNCVVITTSTLAKEPEIAEASKIEVVNNASFAAILKKEKFNKDWDAMKLFVVKNRHESSSSYNRMVECISESGKTAHKTNFLLFSNLKLDPKKPNIMLSNNIKDQGNLEELVRKNNSHLKDKSVFTKSYNHIISSHER